MNMKIKFIAALLSVAFVSSAVVYAVMVANYTVPSNVTVIAMPGITCYNADGTGVITVINWGDLQVSTSKICSIYVVNTGGSSLWLLPAQSLTTENLPNGLDLTWSLSGPTQLTPDQQTSNIALTLTATTSATVGSYSFTIFINAYDSSSG